VSASREQGSQFYFGRYYVFLIGLECFDFIAAFHFEIILFIYNSINIIQIQDKLNINYALQTQCQTNIILKFKIFLNSQD